jgi:hypothetical protein
MMLCIVYSNAEPLLLFNFFSTPPWSHQDVIICYNRPKINIILSHTGGCGGGRWAVVLSYYSVSLFSSLMPTLVLSTCYDFYN